MTSQPNAHVRFRRAIEGRALWMAQDAARELPNLPLEDQLPLVQLYAERGSPKFEKATMRWLERYLMEASPRLQHSRRSALGAIDFEHGQLEVEESKTEAGEGREIDLAPSLLDELKTHWAEHPRAGPDDLVFPTRSGRPRDRSNSRGRLATILKRANKARAKQELPAIEHVTNHTLRRTFASLMYEAGGQPTDVMAAMGHKSSKLALEVYARKMTRKRDTAERMEALVWAQTGTNDQPTFGGVASLDIEKARHPAL